MITKSIPIKNSDDVSRNNKLLFIAEEKYFGPCGITRTDDDTGVEVLIENITYEINNKGDLIVISKKYNRNGTFDSTDSVQYMKNGKRIEEIQNVHPSPNSTKHKTVFEYDSRGNLVHIEYFSKNEMIADTKHTNTIEGEGKIDKEWVNAYIHRKGPISNTLFLFNDQQYLMRIELDDPAGGKKEYIEMFQYSDAGNRLKKETDLDADGETDIVVNYTYNAMNKVIREEMDHNGDSIYEKTIATSYNENGKIIVNEWDTTGDGNIDWKLLCEYNKKGNMFSYQEDRLLSERKISKRFKYKYNDNDELISSREFVDSKQTNGFHEKSTVHLVQKYDKCGNLVSQLIDGDNDGKTDWIKKYDYSCWADISKPYPDVMMKYPHYYEFVSYKKRAMKECEMHH
ncbi:MAG: hypothetical protein GY847_38505 [Proteobacteria bacterium]|nr:hypothetical protein [Pseudomonadota bacterium]